MKLLYGFIYGFIAHLITFLQLQGNIKYGWFQKYPIILLLSGIPISYCFIKSAEYLVAVYDGQIWPSRLIGFGIGVIVFSLMSKILFQESFTPKTIVCLALATCIMVIQIMWK